MGDFSHGEQLRQLPLRALVAFASRCARRVQSFYVLPEDHPTKQTSTAAIDTAIRVAEEFAMGGAVDVKKTAAALRDAEESFAVVQEEEDAGEGATHAAKASLAAVGAANIAFAVQSAEWSGEEIWTAIEAAGESMIAAMPDTETATRALAFDLETLAELDLGQFPEIGETVDPMEDGPLGSLNPPKERRKPEPTGAGSAASSTSDRTLQALERIDALQSEIEEEEPDPRAKQSKSAAAKSSTPKSNRSATTEPGGASVSELQERLQRELERVLAAKTALDEERIQLQTEREAFEARLKKAPGARGGDDAEQRKLAKERQQLQTLRTAFEEEQNAFAEELADFETRQTELRQVERRLKRERAKLKARQEQFVEQRKRLRKHRDKLKAKQQQLRELENSGQAAGGAPADLLQKLQPIQQGLQQLDFEQTTLKSDLDVLQQALSDAAGKGLTSIAVSSGESDQALQEENAQLQAEVQRLQNQVAGNSVERESLEEERQKLKKAHEALEQRAKTFQENERALAQALDKITAEQNRIESRQSELDKLQHELESQQNSFQSQQSRFQDLIDVTFRR